MVRVLVVEDDEPLAASLRRALAYEGYEVTVAGDGPAALAAAGGSDVVVLDRMLPGLDGLAVCRRLREFPSRPLVLMLTARDAVADRVAGLDAGADDYLVKPFDYDELLARVRALLRRPEMSPKSGTSAIAAAATAGGATTSTNNAASATNTPRTASATNTTSVTDPSSKASKASTVGAVGAAGEAAGPEPPMVVADVTVDVSAHEVRRGQQAIELTAQEFALLEYFVRHPRQVLTRAQLRRAVWGMDFDSASNVVDVYVGYLRAKLGEPRLLHTVRGVGYVLRP